MSRNVEQQSSSDVAPHSTRTKTSNERLLQPKMSQSINYPKLPGTDKRADENKVNVK
jgi:hypothetical protein